MEIRGLVLSGIHKEAGKVCQWCFMPERSFGILPCKTRRLSSLLTATIWTTSYLTHLRFVRIRYDNHPYKQKIENTSKSCYRLHQEVWFLPLSRSFFQKRANNIRAFHIGA